MNAKEYLQQVKKLDVLISNKKEQLKTLREHLEVKGINFENDGSANVTRNITMLNDIVISITTLDQEIENDIQLYADKLNRIINTIDSLDSSEEISLLYKRYIHFQSWEEIAKQLNVSYKHVFKLHKRALENIEKIIKLDTK